MPKFVKDIMNKEPKILNPEEPMHKAATLMHTYEIHELPVVDKSKKILGHVHANDLLKAVSEQKPHATPVKHIMNKPPVVLAENTPIPEAVNQLVKAKAKSAPIVNEKGELSGLLHVQDIEDKVPEAKEHVEKIHQATRHHHKKAA
jgi:CBS domain-containing protein